MGVVSGHRHRKGTRMPRLAAPLAAFLTLVAVALVVLTPSAPAATERTKCGTVVATAFTGNRKWYVGVDKISCAAGKLTIVPLTKLAASTRKRNTVKTGSFTCMIYPGGGECKGKAGAAVGFASALFGAP